MGTACEEIAQGPGEGEILSETEFRTWAAMRSLRTHDWKLVESLSKKRIELYDLRSDPGESINLAEQFPERVAELQARSQAILDASPAVDRSGVIGAPDEDLSDQMKAIGYLGDNESE